MKLTGFGYTLLELVIAIAAIGILGIILTDTFVQNLRGQKKVAIITQVKQSGQAVLDRLTNQVKGAEKVVCSRQVTTTGHHILVVAQKGVYHRFIYVPATPTANPPANGYIGYDNPPTTVTLSDNSTILTNPCIEEIDAPFDTLNAIKLTDTNTVSGVSIKKSCDIGTCDIFSRTTGANGKDAITVDFKVDVSVGAGTTVENLVSEGGVRFNTTIQLR